MQTLPATPSALTPDHFRAWLARQYRHAILPNMGLGGDHAPFARYLEASLLLPDGSVQVYDTFYSVRGGKHELPWWMQEVMRLATTCGLDQLMHKGQALGLLFAAERSAERRRTWDDFHATFSVFHREDERPHDRR